jgi:8-oxo-dGTP pyrophosphatase MutT (NUDIX family)
MQKKAGLIPYHCDGAGQMKFLFMIPSDPKYGGSKPSIAKGMVEPNEVLIEAAIREAEEELGFILENALLNTLALEWRGQMKTSKKKYDFSVYSCGVKSMQNFSKPHYETGSTHWLTREEFLKVGREDHKDIVSHAWRQLSLRGKIA